MPTTQRIPRPEARWRNAAGTILMTLGVLIAIAIGGLIITSIGTNQTVHRARHRAPGPAPAADTGRQRRPSHDQDR